MRTTPRTLVCLALLLAACRADAPAKRVACVPGEETPYDGIDQDCDGADLIDVDGDGEAASVAGGTDCDDADASIGATGEETPYDGVDQDCDGADLTDVDGDGWDATRVGGEDCDDEDAAVHPGAAEVAGNGRDDDCDGRLDEYLVCWDGSGDFTTIQEGIDGVEDGSTLEICSGTYVENVVMEARDLTIEGDDPIGVVLTPADRAGIALLATDGALSLANMTFDATGEERCTGVYAYEMTSVDIEAIDSCMCDSARFVVYVTGDGGAEVSRSRFCDASAGVYADRLSITANVFVGETFISPIADSAHLANNVWTGGPAHIRLFSHACYGKDPCPPSLNLENNTFVDVTGLGVSVFVDYYAEMPRVSFRNNIFASSTVEGALWWVQWVDDWEHQFTEARVAAWQSNIVYDITGDLAYFTSIWDEGYYDRSSTETTEYSDTLLAASITSSPEFTPGPAGSYTLSATSAAVDAGAGTDADGSPADIGAFGGANSDWWKEYPWPLP